MSIEINLTEDEQDCLQELMNIAYGSATAAVADIFDAFATLSIPRIRIVNLPDLNKHLHEELDLESEHLIALQELNGSISGENMFVIDRKSAINVSKKFGLEDDELNDDEVSDMILELTNILSSSTVGKLAEDLESHILFSPPSIKIVNSISDLNNDFINNYEKVIIISTRLTFEDLEIDSELLILTTDNSILLIKEKLNKILDTF